MIKNLKETHFFIKIISLMNLILFPILIILSSQFNLDIKYPILFILILFIPNLILLLCHLYSINESFFQDKKNTTNLKTSLPNNVLQFKLRSNKNES